MKLNYFRHRDYLLPDLGLSEEDCRPIGKYGHMRLEYLQEELPGLYTRPLLSGELIPHLHEIDQTCRDHFDLIMRQMKVTEGISEQLKVEEQLERVRRMNSIHMFFTNPFMGCCYRVTSPNIKTLNKRS